MAFALIPVAGPIAAAVVGAVAAGFGIRALVLGKVVRDPPRRDFGEPTEASSSTLDSTVVGDTPIENAGARLVQATDNTARYLDAMVRAFERSWGAEIAGDREMQAARLEEAFRFAQLVSDGFVASSELSGPFRKALEQLHDEARTALETAGVPGGYLETPRFCV